LFVLAGVAIGSRPRPNRVLAEALVMATIPESRRRELLERARQLGRLPVIVGLRLPPGAEGPAEAEAIASVRSRLLQDLGVTQAADGGLAGSGITNVKLFGTIPFLALTAEPEALERLLQHSLVESVQEDTVAAPL
jgi:hypothetical protein